MSRSPILATLLVVLFGIGVPIALIHRLSDGPLPLQILDPPLLIGIVAWIFVSRAIIDRDSDIGSAQSHCLTWRGRADDLVDQSIFGVGFCDHKADLEQPEVPPTHRLISPDRELGDLLPPPIPVRAQSAREIEPNDAHRPVHAVLGPTPEPSIEILATEKYTICRGDTFWSLAEATLGAGHFWAEIRTLNVGREVSTGVVLGPADELRIGWSVLIPLRPSAEEHEHAG